MVKSPTVWKDCDMNACEVQPAFLHPSGQVYLSCFHHDQSLYGFDHQKCLQKWVNKLQGVKYIVTCQPIIGLRNKALLGDRPLNASWPNTFCAAVGEAVFAPCRAVLSRTAQSTGTQLATMTSHGSTLVSKATLVNTVTGQQATVPLVRLRVYNRNWNI
jgi:hypothetical protein